MRILKADIIYQKRKLLLSWGAVVAWMIMIFMFSAQPATSSNQLSLGVTEAVLNIISSLFDIGTESIPNNSFLGLLNHVVRKFAHGTVYAVLYLLVVNAFKRSGVKGKKRYIFSFIYCAAYACTDELHQLFVPGRGCRLTDVFIDCMGAAIGLIINLSISVVRVGIKKQKTHLAKAK